MAFLNDREEAIIADFYRNIKSHRADKLTLVWNGFGVADAVFYSCFEDDNDLEDDDENYEEFVTFVFKATHIRGNLPVKTDENGYFWINYRTFPDEIIADNKKIN